MSQTTFIIAEKFHLENSIQGYTYNTDRVPTYICGSENIIQKSIYFLRLVLIIFYTAFLACNNSTRVLDIIYCFLYCIFFVWKTCKYTKWRSPVCIARNISHINNNKNINNNNMGLLFFFTFVRHKSMPRPSISLQRRYMLFLFLFQYITGSRTYFVHRKLNKS